MASDVVLIYATFPSANEAELIGSALVERGLAACANISAPMTSIYVWEGKIARDTEVAMIVKTRAALAETVIAVAKEIHSYDNPAFVVLPVTGGAEAYLQWVREQASGEGRTVTD